MKIAKIKGFKTVLICLIVFSLIILPACTPEKDNEVTLPVGEEIITLKIAHFMPQQHFFHTNIIEPFIEEVEILTEGRIIFNVRPFSTLASPDALYDMAATGIADITISLQGYTPWKFPVSSVVELPFICDSSEMGTEILYELYNKFPEIQEEYKDTKVLWLFQNDPEYLMMVDEEIHSLDDLNELKMRTGTGVTYEAVHAWGGLPILMPINDVYSAVRSRAIDGATGPLSVLESFGLSDVFNIYIGGPFTIANFFVVMNKSTWEKLSPQDQEIFESLAEKYRKLTSVEFDKAGKRALENAIGNGATYIQLSEDEQKRFEDSLSDVYQDWVDLVKKKGIPGEEILEEVRRLSSEYKNNRQ